jgi:hypothetical protein
MLMLPSPEALVAPPLQVSSTRPISGPSPPVCVARFAPALSEDSASLSLQKKKKKREKKERFVLLCGGFTPKVVFSEEIKIS